MTKRSLDEAEKNLCLKQIKRMEEERKYQSYLLEHSDLMLSKGLYENYQFKKREFQVKKRVANQEIFELDFKITELKRQLNEGVEIKEKKK